LTNPLPSPVTVLAGVEIPSWLKAFDCRWPEDEDLPKDPSGTYTMYGSERAEYALGLRGAGENYFDYASEPSSIQGYCDTRKECWEDEASSYVRRMIESAEEERAKYLACDNPANIDRGHGGSGYYIPVAIALCNFGASLICDRRDYKVQYFQD
jgi:hypothetical protein